MWRHHRYSSGRDNINWGRPQVGQDPAWKPIKSRVGIFAGKNYFCHLPVLTGFNRQKVAEIGKNENGPVAQFTCFWKPVNTSIRNTWCHQARVVLDSDFQADSTLTHLTIQVTQLWLNSTLYFSWLTQLRLNSNHKFSNLTQLWLNSFESELSQVWLTTITFYLIWPKVVARGGGLRPNVVVGWSFPCKTTDKCKILTFFFRKISASTLTQAVSSWLNSDSNDDQRDSTLTRLISFIFTTDSTLTRLIWVRVESNLTHDSWVQHNPASG